MSVPSHVFVPVMDMKNQLKLKSDHVAVIVLLCAGNVFGLLIVIVGKVLSKVTSERSVVPVTVSPALPNKSSKFIVNGIGPSASLPFVVYVAVHAAPAHTTLALFQNMVTLTHVKFSLPVNESVMMFPDKARDHDMLFDCIFTPDNIGFTPNEVK